MLIDVLDTLFPSETNVRPQRGVFLSVGLAFLIVLASAVGMRLAYESADLIAHNKEEIRAVFVPDVSAADYSSQLMLSSARELRVSPGQRVRFSVGYKNTGTQTWVQSGGNYVSVYTWNPKYRKSTFVDASWKSSAQPATVKSATKPGEIGFVEFYLTAPSTPGTYTETFHLAAEDLLWIPGGQVSVNIIVGGAAVAPSQSTPTPTPAPTPTPTTAPSTSYKASKLLQSAESLTFFRGGEELPFRVLIKNVGSATWEKSALAYGNSGVTTATTDPSFEAGDWASESIAVNLTKPVLTGYTTFVDFRVRAPQKRGNYIATFHIQVNGQAVEGSEFNIPVYVTNDGPNATAVQPPPVVVNSNPEPIIRVGTLTVDEETDWEIVLQNPTGFDVTDGAGRVLATVPANGSVTSGYLNGKYWYDLGSGRLVSTSYLRFVPKVPNSIFTVTNFDRQITRHSRYSDNTFRHILEIRWNSDKNRTWLINELGMEYYLRGLAETSNISHLEFQKALITAARTYGYYHWQRATKHASEFYHVDAYYDQVYKGYGQELRTPRLTESAIATRGRIVEYEGRTAITPYFSRSDGRTRDWSEVWYGDVPWAKGVPVPCDEGKTLWGHGVGMSASGALCMANQGQTWDQILKYFYTGITLDKKWD